MFRCLRVHSSDSWCWAERAPLIAVIQWVLIQGIALAARDVSQGVTIAAALIGVAYLSDIIPAPR
jgi:hypothetical protein